MPLYLNIYVRMSLCVGVSDGPFVLESHLSLENIKITFSRELEVIHVTLASRR